MELIGSIEGISRDVISGTSKITFSVEDERRAVSEAQPLSGCRLCISVKPYRKKRSLDANAYYWTLVGKLAASLHVSNAYVHNRMLRRYGQFETVNGRFVFVVLPDTEEAERIADEAETYHVKPTSEVKTGDDLMTYRTYVMMRGSHSYDSKEMSALIDGLVSECKEVGIETLTPDELARMMDSYRKRG